MVGRELISLNEQKILPFSIKRSTKLIWNINFLLIIIRKTVRAEAIVKL